LAFEIPAAFPEFIAGNTVVRKKFHLDETIDSNYVSCWK